MLYKLVGKFWGGFIEILTYFKIMLNFNAPFKKHYSYFYKNITFFLKTVENFYYTDLHY